MVGRKSNIISASEILQAGGIDKWAKKTKYESKNIKMSGIIKLTDEEFEKALKSLDS